ncbi:MAG TPA: hypothetical protein VMU84_08785 [Thermoanaerobaculia bacterium]|nr:hypothetical protein [Thermoanaerobaculia bacterium]
MAEAAKTSNPFRLASLAWDVSEELDLAIRLDPDNVDARVDLVRFYTMTPRIAGGSDSKARSEIKEIAKRDPSLGHFAKGYMAYRDKQFGVARKEFNEALSSAKSSQTKILVWTWLGWLSQESQQYATAFDVWSKMIDLDPTQLQALYEIGRTSSFCGCELERGEAALNRYLSSKRSPEMPSVEDAKKVLAEIKASANPRPAPSQH